jgi:phosphatidylglycerol:prolipoprotein diacylglycerol transferase
LLPRFEFGEVSLWGGYSFDVIIYPYSLLMGAGFLIAFALAAARGKNKGVDVRIFVDVGLYVVVSAAVGAKLLFILVHWESLSANPVTLIRSGGVFYGGFVAATVTVIWLLKQRALPIWFMADLLAPSVALGHAIGRLGCFAAGCCYGRPTGSMWGVTFNDPFSRQISGVPLGVPLHPTQLYDASAELAIFGVLLYLASRKKFDGQIFWSYVLLYASARFTIEFFRGDTHRGMFLNGALSTSQGVALLLFTAAITALLVLRRASGGPLDVLPSCPETARIRRGRTATTALLRISGWCRTRSK